MKTSSRLFSTDHLEELVKRLMPACLPLRLQELVVTAQEVTLMLVSSQSAAGCPLCAEPSTRVHSRYTRTLQDLRLSSAARSPTRAGTPVFLPESGLPAQDLHRTAHGVSRTFLPAHHATARREALCGMGVRRRSGCTPVPGSCSAHFWKHALVALAPVGTGHQIHPACARRR
jgi:hypothetical protein